MTDLKSEIADYEKVLKGSLSFENLAGPAGFFYGLASRLPAADRPHPPPQKKIKCLLNFLPPGPPST